MHGASLLIALFLLPTAFALQITEIMYDPVQEDSLNEWIEVYNNDSTALSLENATVCSSLLQKGFINTSSGLVQDATAFELQPGDYAVITDGGSGTAAYDNFSIQGTAFHSSGASMCTGLANSGDTIIIAQDTAVYDDITYSDMAAEGMSLCRNDSSFYECDPTPGAENVVVMSTAPLISTNATCDISLAISAPDIYVSDYDIIIADAACIESNVTVEYWIENLFGVIVKDRANTTQSVSCQKTIARSWTPDVVEGSEAYVIFSRLADATCGDNNIVNDNVSKIIVVKGAGQSALSSIEITDSDNSTKFGESASVDLLVYRGDTGKYAVDVYVKRSDGTKVSAVSTFHASSKFKTYDLSVPVQLKPNCDGAFADGTYDIVAEGLDVTVTRQIPIAGVSSSNCKTTTVTVSSGGGSFTAPKETKSFSVSHPDVLYVGEEFSVLVRINSTAKKTVSVYSYVYSGNTPVSEGFDGSKWSGAWTANKKDIEVSPGTTEVALESRIEDDAKPGIYSMRVKMKSDREEDLTREVEVRMREIAPSAANTTNNSVPLVETLPSDLPKLSITGRVSAGESKNHETTYRILSFILTKLFKK